MLAIARSADGMLLLIKRLSYPCAMGTVSVAALGESVQLGRGSDASDEGRVGARVVAVVVGR